MKRLWLAFAVVMVFSFSILGWVGTRIYQEAPPLLGQVTGADRPARQGPTERVRLKTRKRSYPPGLETCEEVG
jgi:hypothetical protein